MNSILIVEDEALIALSLQMKLEKLGYNVPAVVHTGEDANSSVKGLTIINGYHASGGAILCQNSSPTIQNCAIIKH